VSYLRCVFQSPALYTALALYAAGLSYFTSAGLCITDACGQTVHYAFLGYPWGVWGAVFYAVVAGLFAAGAVWPLRAAMLVGVGVHAYLVAILIRNGISCLLCLHLAFLALGLAVAAFTVRLSPLVARRYAFLFSLPAIAIVLAPAMFGYAHTQREPDLAEVLDALRQEAAGEFRAGTHSAQTAADFREPVPADEPAKPAAHPEKPVPEPSPKQEGPEPVLLAFDARGTVVQLNLRERPALLFSWWCSSCDRALSEAIKMPPERRPVPVATYFRDRNNLQAEIQRSQEKASLLGPVYHVLEPPAEGVPALLWHDGELRTVVGAASVLDAMAHVP